MLTVWNPVSQSTQPKHAEHSQDPELQVQQLHLLHYNRYQGSSLGKYEDCLLVLVINGAHTHTKKKGKKCQRLKLSLRELSLPQ
jgi:hypothetical protein